METTRPEWPRQATERETHKLETALKSEVSWDFLLTTVYKYNLGKVSFHVDTLSPL